MALGTGWIDAIFGRLFRDLVEFPIPSGLNFTSGIDATQNAQTKLVDVSVREGSLTPAMLAPSAGNIAPAFIMQKTFTATGAAGTLRDVDLPVISVNHRIMRAELRVAVAFAGNAAIRTASAGLGSVILPDAATPTRTFDTTATGVVSDNATDTADINANTQLYLRLDRSVTGRLVFYCERF